MDEDSLGLSKEVGQEDLVVFATSNRVLSLGGGEEVTVDQLMPLH